jgi:succinoglycan biosynthesis protein ExoA
VTAPPFISIVIPVRNEEKALPGLLAEILNQEYDSNLFEVLVADGQSTDGTREIVERVAASTSGQVRLLENPGVKSSAGRNAGVAAARGDIILFLDGHCHLPSRTLLADTVSMMQSSGAKCLCRPQPLIAPLASATGRAIAAVRASKLGHGRDSLIYDLSYSGYVDPSSSGATYTRQALQAVDPYDERFDACEDVELNTRIRKAGFRAYTHPSLAVYYEPRSTVAGLLRQMVRYGRGRIRLAGKHPDTWSLGTLAPMFLLLFGFGLIVSLFTGGIAEILFLSLAAIYLVAVLAASVQLGLRGHARCYWQGPVLYPAIHFGLGWGMLLELLSLRWLRMKKL